MYIFYLIIISILYPFHPLSLFLKDTEIILGLESEFDN